MSFIRTFRSYEVPRLLLPAVCKIQFFMYKITVKMFEIPWKGDDRFGSLTYGTLLHLYEPRFLILIPLTTLDLPAESQHEVTIPAQTDTDSFFFFGPGFKQNEALSRISW